MKDGKDENKSSTASGIHKSRMLHRDKKNRRTCKLRRQSDKTNQRNRH
jgi:hypothetical protein